MKIGTDLTAWKVYVFGVFLVRIFAYSDWIQRDIPRIQSECKKIRTWKTPNTDNFYAVAAKLKTYKIGRFKYFFPKKTATFDGKSKYFQNIFVTGFRGVFSTLSNNFFPKIVVFSRKLFLRNSPSFERVLNTSLDFIQLKDFLKYTVLDFEFLIRLSSNFYSNFETISLGKRDLTVSMLDKVLILFLRKMLNSHSKSDCCG